jgi:glutaminase
LLQIRWKGPAPFRHFLQPLARRVEPLPGARIAAGAQHAVGGELDDHAIEAAEQRLLAQAHLDIGAGEVALDACALLHALDPRQRTRLRALLQQRELSQGELLFRQGDPGDCLYVLTRGSITVSSVGGDGHRLLQRYVSFSPGMMLGETAMLDGQGRTADAIADVPSVVHALRRDALAQLLNEDPALAAMLMANIARHLSERLRHAAAAWRLAAA